MTAKDTQKSAGLIPIIRKGDHCKIVFAVQPEHQDQIGAECVVAGDAEQISTDTHGVVLAFPINIHGERWHALPEQLSRVSPLTKYTGQIATLHESYISGLRRDYETLQVERDQLLKALNALLQLTKGLESYQVESWQDDIDAANDIIAKVSP